VDLVRNNLGFQFRIPCLICIEQEDGDGMEVIANIDVDIKPLIPPSPEFTYIHCV